MENNVQSDTALIDLAIAFFCSVLVLFVFIAFSIVTKEPRQNVESVAQVEERQELNSAGWNAVRERGDFAFFHQGMLNVLDMSVIARGLQEPETSYSGPNGDALFSTSSRYKAIPNASNLQLFVDAEAPPLPWLLARVDLTDDFACPEALRPQLTVFLLPEEEDLAPLTTFSRACDVRLRFAHTKTPGEGEPVRLVLVLSPSQFSSQRVFR